MRLIDRYRNTYCAEFIIYILFFVIFQGEGASISFGILRLNLISSVNIFVALNTELCESNVRHQNVSPSDSDEEKVATMAGHSVFLDFLRLVTPRVADKWLPRFSCTLEVDCIRGREGKEPC